MKFFMLLTWKVLYRRGQQSNKIRLFYLCEVLSPQNTLLSVNNKQTVGDLIMVFPNFSQIFHLLLFRYFSIENFYNYHHTSTILLISQNRNFFATDFITQEIKVTLAKKINNINIFYWIILKLICILHVGINSKLK